MPFPSSREEGKHLPTSDCKQGAMLKFTPPVPCKHSMVRRIAGVLISFLYSCLEKDLVHLTEEKKNNRSLVNPGETRWHLFPFISFFVCFTIILTDIVGVKKEVLSAQNWNNHGFHKHAA